MHVFRQLLFVFLYLYCHAYVVRVEPEPPPPPPKGQHGLGNLQTGIVYSVAFFSHALIDYRHKKVQFYLILGMDIDIHSAYYG